MTMSVSISIAPYGDRQAEYVIYRADISNQGVIRNMGFGHLICKYKYQIYKPVPPTLRKDPDVEEYELEAHGEIPEHDRRDGPWVLIQKMVEDYEKGGSDV